MDGTSLTRANAADWQHQPIGKPAKAQWNANIKQGDMPKLLRGFIPQQMEDKWFCYADGADSHGTVLVHLCHSWTGAEIAVLTISTALTDTSAIDRHDFAKVTEVTWEEDSEETDHGEAWAKYIAGTVCRDVLECELYQPK